MNIFYIDSIGKAVEYIKNNLDKKINLGELSEAAGISRFHIHRIFEAFTGESVFDTVARLKIEQAASILLEDTKITISDLARAKGYKSPSDFSSAF